MDNILMAMVLDSSSSSSDDEMELLVAAIEEERLDKERKCRPHRGSIKGHKSIWRDRIQGHNRLYLDYFSESSVYTHNQFRRKFRMSKSLYLRIVNSVEAHDSYFVQTRNCSRVLGLSPLQKVTATMRMLAYGVAADFMDEYLRIGESTTIESLKKFVKAVVEIFSEEYLRSPNNNDIARLLAEGEQRGFPGMFGSLDCMHWKWKNCPTAWKGMYVGHVHEPTIILEAVASYDLWIWHAYFGLPGSNNDINVLQRSTLFHDLSQGRAPLVNYKINGHDYSLGFYLVDGIYPPWATFVKTIQYPHTQKERNFAKAQESTRKVVERAFGVLQARFAIVREPSRFWHQTTLQYIMKACIIMHNMIVEDEGRVKIPDLNYDPNGDSFPATPSNVPTIELIEFIQNHHSIRNRETHYQLQEDLIEHLWTAKGTQ